VTLEPSSPSSPEGLRGRRCRAGAGLVHRRGARRGGDTLVYNNRNDGPPDLDELWRDFNRKLSGLFGGKGGGGRPNGAW
jgi:hypothetical protein